jgi:hypothetical protein
MLPPDGDGQRFTFSAISLGFPARFRPLLRRPLSKTDRLSSNKTMVTTIISLHQRLGTNHGYPRIEPLALNIVAMANE